MRGAKSVEVVNLRNALRSKERSRQMSTKSSLTPPHAIHSMRGFRGMMEQMLSPRSVTCQETQA